MKKKKKKKEDMTYAHPSYKIDSKKPGSDLAGETAASLVIFLIYTLIFIIFCFIFRFYIN